ncbi:cdc42 effector protein 1 [Protopterus annectens]|uniref:cdc42 effector protein 1 n=1 Tax=Protopterus annectens TaxID=7888 RepID=UPI001CF9921F|nr:cdc42 effector protein 1 [Protopterus annectens]
MSLGKLPVIKSLVSNSSGKRRFKNDLTPDMISPPLGDFRHTMHVGRGGDVFGDTSFLSNHGGDQDASKSNFLLRTFRYVRKSPARGRNSLKETSTPPPPISPIIKNAISLPHISDGFNGSLETIAFKSTPASPSNMTNSYGLESGFLTLPRLSRMEKPEENSISSESELQRSDSLQSFKVDLGPSLMAEVMSHMNYSRSTLNSKGGDDDAVRLYNFQDAISELNGVESELNGRPLHGRTTSVIDAKNAEAINILSTDLNGQQKERPVNIKEKCYDNMGHVVRPSRQGPSGDDSRTLDFKFEGHNSGNDIKDSQCVQRFQGFAEQIRNHTSHRDQVRRVDAEWDTETKANGSEQWTKTVTLETNAAQLKATEQPRCVMEAEEFNRAAQVLANHYGGATRSVALKEAVRQTEMSFGTGGKTPAKCASRSQEQNIPSPGTIHQKYSGGHFSVSHQLSKEEEEGVENGAVESSILTTSPMGSFSQSRGVALACADEEDEIKV